MAPEKPPRRSVLNGRLAAQGFDSIYVKEPTDGPWGQKIREIAKNGRQDITPEQELEYFILDREADVAETIRPKLDGGGVVIADRYYYSTIAYQSHLGLEPDFIRDKNRDFPVPDIVFILDITVETGQMRISQGRGETANLGYEQADFLAGVKAVFDGLTDENIVRIDGALGVDDVSAAVWEKVSGLIDKTAA